MREKNKLKNTLAFFFIITILFVSLASAGVVDWIKSTITGKATSQEFVLNITVGAPGIYAVYNQSTFVDIQENTFTSVIINFSVYTPVGSDNLNHSTATVNLSLPNEDLRENSSCYPYEVDGDYANYTCNITMWWWDNSSLNWAVTAYILDNASSPGINNTVVQRVGATRGIIGGPTPITWSALSPGTGNQTSNNDPYVMNNTGNVDIPSTELKVNATHLRGESDNTEGLWAGNFSINWSSGGSPPAECGGTRMVVSAFTAITGANLSAGNYTMNDGATGQERLFFCIVETQNNLSTQSYSTAEDGLWTVDIGGIVD